jgi:hypothetical protein
MASFRVESGQVTIHALVDLCSEVERVHPSCSRRRKMADTKPRGEHKHAILPAEWVHAMRRVFKNYVRTSDVRVQDVQDCVDRLRTLGHPARALDYDKGGIDFATCPGEQKNVRWITNSELPRPDDAGDFSGDRTKKWLGGGREPEWHHANRILVQIGGDFTQAEIDDIDQAIITCLRYTANVIANERRELLPSDSARDRNISLNIDYAAALDAYTTVSDAVPEARLFKCWKCQQLRQCHEFQDPRSDYHYSYHSQFDRVLHAYAWGRNVACTTCENKMGPRRPMKCVYYWAYEALPLNI